MSYDPFYLQGKGDNVITSEKLDQFIEINPELTDKLAKYNLELRLLEFSHLESFCAWIMSQQISGKVAEMFLHRFRGLVGNITPKNILSTPNDQLRDIGLSRTKTEYIKNIAQFYLEDNQLDNHDDYTSQEILDHYTQIRGIGPWTVNMFMIFNLGRLDIAAPKDLVVRKGLKRLYNLDQIPNVSQSKKIMNSWGDLATIGTILSWAAMGE